MNRFRPRCARSREAVSSLPTRIESLREATPLDLFKGHGDSESRRAARRLLAVAGPFSGGEQPAAAGLRLYLGGGFAETPLGSADVRDGTDSALCARRGNDQPGVALWDRGAMCPTRTRTSRRGLWTAAADEAEATARRWGLRGL
ncbi:unnamed protein product [Lampetra planeri]